MDVVFESIILLAIGLLAITATVFVLAVSLLGRAIRASADETIQTEQARKKDLESQVTELKAEFDKLAVAGNVGDEQAEGLRKRIKKLQDKTNQYNRKIAWIRWKPKLLTANIGVFIPSILFLIAIVLSIVARFDLARSTDANTAGELFYSIVPLIFGTFMVGLVLKAIEEITTSSEEASFARETEALKNALIQVEESKKTNLALVFQDPKPPLTAATNTTLSFKVTVRIVKGAVAKNVQVMFFAPKGFQFVNCTRGPNPSPQHQDYVSGAQTIAELLPSISHNLSWQLKMPSTAGVYKATYAIVCEGFSSGEQEFEIKVT